MTERFLSRWARRKALVQEGKPPAEPAAPAPFASPLNEAEITAKEIQEIALPHTTEVAVPSEAELTLDDVAQLKADSNFAPFVNPKISPEVRNAAMKKLFSAPDFNVMDGLDIYIDDYSKPDPLPLSILRKMASAQFLNLVEPEPEEVEETQAPSSAAQEAISAEATAHRAPDAPCATGVVAEGEEGEVAVRSVSV